MGLFSSKKKEELKRQMAMPPRPELPEFPDLPDDELSDDFPNYESSIADIKKEVNKEDNLNIPKRKSATQHNISKYELEQPMKHFNDEQPMFIKIENYKEAVKSMEQLAKKIADSEGILERINTIRREEEQRIEEWRSDLATIKDKMLDIDKELFGG